MPPDPSTDFCAEARSGTRIGSRARETARDVPGNPERCRTRRLRPAGTGASGKMGTGPSSEPGQAVLHLAPEPARGGAWGSDRRAEPPGASPWCASAPFAGLPPTNPAEYRPVGPRRPVRVAVDRVHHVACVQMHGHGPGAMTQAISFMANPLLRLTQVHLAGDFAAFGADDAHAVQQAFDLFLSLFIGWDLHVCWTTATGAWRFPSGLLQARRAGCGRATPKALRRGLTVCQVVRIGCTVLLSQEPGQRQMAPGENPSPPNGTALRVRDGLLRRKSRIPGWPSPDQVTDL